MPDTSLDRWLRGAGPTLDAGPSLPRGLGDRLRFAAAVIAACPDLPRGPALAWRTPKGIGHHAMDKGGVVGREKPSDLVMPDPKLSRRHFAVKLEGGEAVIEDLGSHNGTWVNGEKTRRRGLLDGDIIEAGGQVFLFLRGEQEAASGKP